MYEKRVTFHHPSFDTVDIQFDDGKKEFHIVSAGQGRLLIKVDRGDLTRLLEAAQELMNDTSGRLS